MYKSKHVHKYFAEQNWLAELWDHMVSDVSKIINFEN